ncbi:hypothetical protein GCM10010387_02310 [Streptomyces inusitatus]|uniref:Protein kinase domain-containing protein n=1 Tax=Streptomyces inusitatus TaxID=68221 RepID=A0A918UJ17_9ACTN|nr:serine/threonine-protein kinase [Streptomyces inusitatus]GGZ13800.1 hypothetical protein GCM10010387_02310 [Streptomyces inusitatus]
MNHLTADDPRRIGEYRLLSRLGEGGMGRVYLARSDRGRTVAVKLVRRELAGEEEFRDRFRREVRAARRVGGEWTAPVLDADTEAPVPWVATGYVAGPGLDTVIARGPLPERSVRALGSGLAHALSEIHAAGLIHRDLKPSNVLITIDGPRVIDFGIARALDGAEGGPTRTGSVVGSPGFMAPEQVRGERVTAACDVFCLGAVLVYAATGRHPFGPVSAGRHAVMYRIAEEEPDLTGVPAGLADLVRDCLRKDPSRRPAPAQILERTAPPAGEGSEPWLPGALIAQLGRQAVWLLEAEEPPHSRPRPRSEVPPQVPRDRTRVQSPYEAPSPTLVSATTAPDRPYPPPDAWLNTPAPGPFNQPSTKRAGRTGPLLGLAAVLLSLVAGGAALHFFTGPDKPPADDPKSARTATTSAAPSPSTAAAEDGETAAPAATVPEAYLGTWRAVFETADGEHTRTMTLTEGTLGTPVMTLTGSGPSYECGWSATLRAAGPPLELGPTDVASGDPAECSPGQWSRLRLSGDSTIVRELVGSTGAPLTYAKTDY